MKKLLSIILAILTVLSIVTVGASAADTSLALNKIVKEHENIIFDEDNDLMYITEPNWTLVDLAVHLIMQDDYYYSVDIKTDSLANHIGTGTEISFTKWSNGFPSGVYTVVVRGDLDGDSWCTINDKAIVNEYINGNIELSYCQERAADIACDGKITSRDLTQISNAVTQYEKLDTDKNLESQDSYQTYLNILSLSNIEINPNLDKKPTLLQKIIIFFDMIFTFLGIEKLSLLLKIL